MSARKTSAKIMESWTGTVPIDSVIPNPEQPRRYFDAEEMERTSKSCDARQIQPILVIPHHDPKRPAVKWMIVDGERRWRGLKSRGKATIKVIHDPETTTENIFSASFAANFCRAGHTHAETANAIDRELKAGKTYEAIGDMVGKTAFWARNEHALLKLHPKLMRLMDPPTDKNARLSVKVALLLTQVEPDAQVIHYERAKKLKADQAFHKLRTSRTFTVAAETSPHRDARYLRRKLDQVLAQANVFADVPRAMLKSLAPEVVTELEGVLDKIDSTLARCRERLKETKS